MSPLAAKLQSITYLLSQRSEVLIIFVVIGVVFMMILPLPTALVDTLIAFNISVAALVVVLAMYLPGPLAFSTFPALLLITTLFRLALSITTTRLILLQADAGTIVEVFGNFVVGGNLVVGMVVFLILTIVNFLVITKGSERVAEVSARFTLDALPGKQMSIDSDLRGGLIDAPTAQKRRADLGKESQLFGAMDGAMKFVKGDAIAGIIIVIVNIVGGFSIGVLQLGLSSGEAMKIYSILTVGDGLIAQIPALLISLTAGLIITRVTDTGAQIRNVGQEMASELSSEPKAWVIASFVMFGFSLIPGMPFFSFLTLSLIFGGCGAYQIWSRKVAFMKNNALASGDGNKEKEREALEEEVEAGATDVKTVFPYDKFVFAVNTEEKENPACDSILKTIRRARNRLVTQKGYSIPEINILTDGAIDKTEFQLRIHGVPLFMGSLFIDKFVVYQDDMSEALLESMGKSCHQGKEDWHEDDVYWVDAEAEEKLKSEEVKYISAEQYIEKRVKNFLNKESYQFVGVETVNKIMLWVGDEFPKLAETLQQSLSLSKLSEVWKTLVQENISVRSVEKIIEVLADKAPIERDSSILTDYVRIALRDQICYELADNNTLNVCLIEPELEEVLRGSLRQTSNGPFLAISEEESQQLIAEIKHQEHNNDESDQLTIVVAQDIRRSLRDLIKHELFHVPVLSYSEVAPHLSIVPVARISL